MRAALSIAIMVLGTCGLGVPAPAGPFTLQDGGFNNRCAVLAVYKWDGRVGGEDIPKPDGPWFGDAGTTGDSVTALDAVLQHGIDRNGPCHGGEKFNNTPVSVALTDVVPPASKFRSRTAASQVSHGNHWDLGTIRSEVFTDKDGKVANAKFSVAAQHLGAEIGKVVPSYHNGLDKPVRVTLTPDYRVKEGGTTTIVDGPARNLGLINPHSGTNLPALEKTFPRPPANGVLTSYRLTVESSPATDTHLAFLGTVDGEFTELDLDLALFLFLGADTRFFAPNLRPYPDVDAFALFVAVDLTQWLGEPPVLAPGDVFSLVDGTTDALPGVLVSLAPIRLGATGWESDAPYSGDVVVTGLIDGSVTTPEPGTLLLLTGAAAGVLALRRGRPPRGPRSAPAQERRPSQAE